MVVHMHHDLNANEGFVTSFASKFITCFIDIHLHALGFTLGMKSQSFAYLLRGSEHIY